MPTAAFRSCPSAVAISRTISASATTEAATARKITTPAPSVAMTRSSTGTIAQASSALPQFVATTSGTSLRFSPIHFAIAMSSAIGNTQAKARRAGREALGDPVDEIPTLVVVRADKSASYGAVRRTLSEAQERGFAHFSLIILRGVER